MRRSEMLEEIQNLVFMCSALDVHIDLEEADFLLKGLETKGMLPPPIPGALKFTAHQLPNCRLEYEYFDVNQWEPEDDDSDDYCAIS